MRLLRLLSAAALVLTGPASPLPAAAQAVRTVPVEAPFSLGAGAGASGNAAESAQTASLALSVNEGLSPLLALPQPPSAMIGPSGSPLLQGPVLENSLAPVESLPETGALPQASFPAPGEGPRAIDSAAELGRQARPSGDDIVSSPSTYQRTYDGGSKAPSASAPAEPVPASRGRLRGAWASAAALLSSAVPAYARPVPEWGDGVQAPPPAPAPVPVETAAETAAAGGAAAAWSVSIFLPLLLPLAYEAARWMIARRSAPKAATPAVSLRESIGGVTASMVTVIPVMAMLAAFAYGGVAMAGALAAYPAFIALVTLFGAAAGEMQIAEGRSKIVGGYQESHDQKYRIDPMSGRLKDIRGHKYGEDRFEVWRRGPVTPGESSSVRLLTALAGALPVLLASPGVWPMLLYAVLVTLAFASVDLYKKLFPPPPPPSPTANDIAHASRFSSEYLMPDEIAEFLAAMRSRGVGTAPRPVDSPLYRIAEVTQFVLDHYPDPLDASRLYQGALRGILGALDPHSRYLEAGELSVLEEELDKDYTGVGLMLGPGEAPGRPPSIRQVLPGSPAARAGLRRGDLVLDIAGRDTAAMPFERAAALIRGPAGTMVRLKAARPAPAEGNLELVDGRLLIRSSGRTPAPQVIAVELQRVSVKKENVVSRLLEDGVGYVYFQMFREGAAEEVSGRIEELIRQGAKVLVLDLRFNGGGRLDEVADLSSRFLRQGQTIVSTVSRGRTTQELRASEDGPFADIPLAVLVNGHSASGSEILAAALQDHGRARLYGSRTYGKGTSHIVLPLKRIFPAWPDDDGIQLTTERWLTPKGRSIQRNGEGPRGVVPDRPVQVAEEIEIRAMAPVFNKLYDAESPEDGLDPVLHNAIQDLKALTTSARP